MANSIKIKDCLGCAKVRTCFWGVEASKQVNLFGNVPARDCYYKNGFKLLAAELGLKGGG